MIFRKIVFLFLLSFSFLTIFTACGGGGGGSSTDTGTAGTTTTITATGTVTVSAISGNTTEAGGTATFTVVLATQPTADVTIGVTSSDTTEGTVSPSTLTFTNSNGTTAQTVTVTGVDDSTVDGDVAYTITLAAATSTDTAFSGVDPSDVSVTNTDNDTAGVTVSAISGNTTEAGGTATFTVVLASQPTADVTIGVTSSDTTEGTVSASSLTFTSSNYGTAQTVTVTGVDDSIDDGDIAYTITLAAATSTDSNYNGVDPADVSVTNTDNDTASITVSAISNNTGEDAHTATFTVLLASQPTADVTIGVSSSDTTEGTVSASSLTLTSSNWNTAQTVTVTGVNDSSADGDQSYSIVLAQATSTDTNFSIINPTDVSVTNVDNDSGNWAQEAYIKAPNAEAGDYFGRSVAVDADTVVVGAYFEASNQTTITNGTAASANNSASASGAAYVFKRTGTTWAQEAYLKAPNAETIDDFGFSVAVDTDTVVVGAYLEDSNQTTITNGTTASADNSTADSGAAYVFKRTGTTWAQEAYLKAPNAGIIDDFGFSVAVDTDTVVVGAYHEDSNQTTITNGTTASADNTASNAGAAYVFKRSGTTWAQEAYLKAPNADSSDFFGYSVSVDTDTVVVGANGDDSGQNTITNGTTASADNSASLAGAAYVFKRTGATWAQEAYLKAPNAEASDYFGYSVAVNTDTVVAGAYWESSNQTTITNGTTASADNTASQSGAVYVFKRTGTTWAQEAYLKAPNAEAGDSFGYSVSVNTDTVVVGAEYEDSSQTTITNGTTASADNTASLAGAVYVFKRTGTTWAQEAYLKAPNAEGSDYFGYGVAVDTDTIVVGAYGEDSNQTTITNGTTASADNTASQAGAAYVFKRATDDVTLTW